MRAFAFAILVKILVFVSVFVLPFFALLLLLLPIFFQLLEKLFFPKLFHEDGVILELFARL